MRRSFSSRVRSLTVLGGFAVRVGFRRAQDDRAVERTEGNVQSREPLLVATYQGRYRPTPMQLRAAIESLPFERPKLGAVAVGRMNGDDFAAMLERAIARSGKAPKVADEAKLIAPPT